MPMAPISAIFRFLVNNLLLLNQFPDVQADQSIGRRHFPLVAGRRAAQWQLAVPRQLADRQRQPRRFVDADEPRFPFPGEADNKRYARELTAEEKAKQQEILDARIAAMDAVITTASVPGRKAPTIITRAAVERMKQGAVIVDIAAEQGGNCELTRAGETVLHHGVKSSAL